MESEKPTGSATQYGSSSGSGVQRNDASGEAQAADDKPPGAPDVEMGAENSCEAQIKQAKTITGLEICAL